MLRAVPAGGGSMLEKFFHATQKEWEADGVVNNTRDILIVQLLFRHGDIPKPTFDRILACNDESLLRRAIHRDLDFDHPDDSILDDPTP
jgi:hypothetical protein